ncbi:hypothetical protein D8674_027099 [Pyrus ussuriensis x Pyrus communis]|uniref:Small EDRK-rich factor-like N-terminal domain-containing protein n=1 Tax=Pyrus ussuriensis x Pyrus communis TaxID=2448454 RepID=A0A5N5I8U9_9ROSA|nr:hypothetical protein D8674_027099 [Pyrus ussuriensis x Pyrus communis]
MPCLAAEKRRENHEDQIFDFVLCSAFSPQPNGFERGNQRDRDRERAQARSGGNKSKPKNDGLTPEQRRERDAKALQEKAKKKAAAQQAGGINAGGKK